MIEKSSGPLLLQDTQILERDSSTEEEAFKTSLRSRTDFLNISLGQQRMTSTHPVFRCKCVCTADRVVSKVVVLQHCLFSTCSAVFRHCNK